jgi:PKHD-type hydroxylase
MRLYSLLSMDDALSLYQTLTTTTDWQPGRTADPRMEGSTKVNNEYRHGELSHYLLKAIQRHPTITDDFLVSKIALPKFSKYTAGQYYAAHGDSSTINGIRTDIACTIWLTPKDAYEGGELIITQPDGTDYTVKGDLGDIFVYPCWLPHRVATVVSGERLCAVTWLQSKVRSQEQRELLRMMLNSASRLHAENHSEAAVIMAAIHKLLRLWAD